MVGAAPDTRWPALGATLHACGIDANRWSMRLSQPVAFFISQHVPD